jgi:hypothetical protein
VALHDNISDAFRIATWRLPRTSTTGMTPLTIFGIFSASVLAEAIIEFLLAGANLRAFSPYGLNSFIAVVAVQALIIVFFAREDLSSATIRNLVLLYLVSTGLSDVERAIFQALGWDDPEVLASPGPATVAWLIMTIWIVWLSRGASQVFKLTPSVSRPKFRGVAFAIVILFAPAVLPIWPIFVSAHFDRAQANIWEFIRNYKSQSSADAEREAAEYRAAEIKAARLEGRQSALLDAAVSAVEPRDPTAANVFTIGVAGYGEQDVFKRETEQSLAILTSRFHLGARVLSLINNEATANEQPMASVQNLGAALRAVGARMDRDKDVLILTMTSHGSPDGFALQYRNSVYRTLDPQTLKTLLDESGIKNRILIVSSCYSGAFVAPLADEDTVVITAASSTHTSFGCANDRKWTYFGEAFFEKGLSDGATLSDAFVSAKATVAAWEGEKKLVPSEPQIFVGGGIARRFPDLIGTAVPSSAIAAEAGSASVNRE